MVPDPVECSAWDEQEGIGTTGSRGREGQAKERAGEVATHEGHAGRMEGKGRERKDAVGSGLHVLLWLPESRL